MNRPKFHPTIHLLADTFARHNFKLFVVGGFIRDHLSGLNPKDIDLSTDATPEQVNRMSKILDWQTKATGQQFLVSNVVIPDFETIEIATFRVDLGNGRRPDAVRQGTIEEDVQRRDLTINALFMDLQTGKIVDLVGGKSDLENKIVRFVGHARKRIEEDPLRVLRAVRFKALFGEEGSFASETFHALSEASSSPLGVALERTQEEFCKAVTRGNSRVFLHDLVELTLTDWCLPSWARERILEVDIDEVPLTKCPSLLMAWLCQGRTTTEIKKELNRLKWPSVEISFVLFLLKLDKFLKFQPLKGGFVKFVVEFNHITSQIKQGKLMRIDLPFVEWMKWSNDPSLEKEHWQRKFTRHMMVADIVKLAMLSNFELTVSGSDAPSDLPAHKIGEWKDDQEIQRWNTFQHDYLKKTLNKTIL